MKKIYLKKEDVMLDRIGITIYEFGNFKITESEYNSLREVIGEKLFKTSNHFQYNSTFSSILLEHVQGTGYLKYIPKKQTFTLSLKLYLNPTRIFMNHYFCKKTIKKGDSYNGKDNFIPYHIKLKFGQERIQKHSFILFLEKIQYIINEFSKCIESNVLSYNESLYPKVSFSIIEIYWDMFCCSPYQYIDFIKESWESSFVESKSPQIIAPSLSEELEKSARYLIGKNRTKERFKLYTKTSNLIRHEAEFRNERIRSMSGTNVLKNLSVNSIDNFIEPLVSHTIEVFNNIEPNESKVFEEPTTFKPIYNLARVVGNDAELFDLILNELKYNRRLVSRPIFYPRTRKLLDTGDWKNPTRKIYTPSSELLNLVDRLYDSNNK